MPCMHPWLLLVLLSFLNPKPETLNPDPRSPISDPGQVLLEDAGIEPLAGIGQASGQPPDTPHTPYTPYTAHNPHTPAGAQAGGGKAGGGGGIGGSGGVKGHYLGKEVAPTSALSKQRAGRGLSRNVAM